jgi:uncharacterized protein (DUF3084 family)
MDWALLLLLACPIMMLFCMKGMSGGNKDKDAKGKKTKGKEMQPQVSQQEMQSLQIKMADMMEQNRELVKEVKALKESQSPKKSHSEQSHSKVVELKEGQEERRKAE